MHPAQAGGRCAHASNAAHKANPHQSRCAGTNQRCVCKYSHGGSPAIPERFLDGILEQFRNTWYLSREVMSITCMLHAINTCIDINMVCGGQVSTCKHLICTSCDAVLCWAAESSTPPLPTNTAAAAAAAGLVQEHSKWPEDILCSQQLQRTPSPPKTFCTTPPVQLLL